MDALFAIFAVIAVLIVVRGFILTYLWSWFLTPLGLPEISISHAIGISLIVAFLTYENAKKESECLDAFVSWIVTMLLAFGVGYVVHRVMVG